MIVKELGLEEARPVSTPGESEAKWEEEANKVPLDEKETSRYRAFVARANYRAADRTDIMYSVKEICRHMAAPTVGARKKLQRLGRYLQGNRRMATTYARQNEES